MDVGAENFEVDVAFDIWELVKLTAVAMLLVLEGYRPDESLLTAVELYIYGLYAVVLWATVILKMCGPYVVIEVAAEEIDHE